jgi:hypothetical protein
MESGSPVGTTPERYRRKLERLVRSTPNEMICRLGAEDVPLVTSLQTSLLRYVSLHENTWQTRVCDGRIVDGHGDVRPEHIYLTDPPALIDCIEFDSELRSVDTLDELAFLVMECERQGAEWLTPTLVTWYEQSAGDRVNTGLFSFYKCYRALVRAKVRLLTPAAAHGGEPSPPPSLDDYLRLAARYREVFDPKRLLIVGGLSGSGKTTLARALEEQFHFQLLETDTIRQELFPRQEEGALEYGVGSYNEEARLAVYRRMLARCDEQLASRRCLMLVGTFATRALREQALQLATRHQAIPLVIWCECSPDVAQARIRRRLERGGSESAARPEFISRQAAEAERPAEACFVDTTQPLDRQTAMIREILAPD